MIFSKHSLRIIPTLRGGFSNLVLFQLVEALYESLLASRRLFDHQALFFIFSRGSSLFRNGVYSTDFVIYLQPSTMRSFISHVREENLWYCRSARLTSLLCSRVGPMRSLLLIICCYSWDTVPQSILCATYFFRDVISYSHLFPRGSHFECLAAVSLYS